MAEAAHQRFIATTWGVSPDDKERPVKKQSIFVQASSFLFFLAARHKQEEEDLNGI